jgi:uncharacterized protein (TIGR02145 family)
MKRTIIILIITLLVRTILAQDATNIYRNTVNSTVTIETDIGLGSGFFISENIIVTNYHVIEGASEVYCYTNNSSTKYKIEGYLGVDKLVDLILLKVSGLNRIALKIASGSAIPGQKIYVIGSPKGLPATISDGIISGLRDFDGHKLVQITAPISPGSSGGPVLNSIGEVIGVSVGQFKDGQNLNFAIPKSSLELLLSHKTTSPQPFTKLYNITGSLTDARDGKSYKTVKIGVQVWMAENLNFATDSGSWCYDKNPENCSIYGRLYSWEIAKTACPSGWHLPSYNEWNILSKYLGGYAIAGGKLKSKLGWTSPNTNATNESGFSGLPGGILYDNCYGNGIFVDIGKVGYFWSGPGSFTVSDSSSTKYEALEAWFKSLKNSSDTISFGKWEFPLSYYYPYQPNKYYPCETGGFSLRCLKDN